MAAVYAPRAPGAPQIPPAGPNAQIYFSPYHETHYAFNNVSDHPVTYKGVLYRTAEHMYQALKFLEHQPAIAQLVNDSTDPQRLANSYNQHVQPDWPRMHLQMMEKVLLLKFSQYPGLQMELLATGEAELIQLGSHNYWSRENGSGNNEFGKALMRVRSTLRAES
ncbi:hypothetical protein FRC20_001911 [Serendipita sp. 405]|nr:hypothetical protein FRC20_001911 [Serendipita sp. 405]